MTSAMGVSNFLAFAMPEQASTVAADVDWLFYGILWVTIIFCAIIFFLMLAFMVKYRFKGDEAAVKPPEAAGHSTTLELTWTIIPVVITIVIFYYGFRGFLDMTVVPPNAYDITVKTSMWQFSYEYPNGMVSDTLVVPRDRPIRLVLESADVIHAWYCPAFRVQKMAMPGRYNRIWFQATKNSDNLDENGMPLPIKYTANNKTPTDDSKVGYRVYCAMYCGQRHGSMWSNVSVIDPDKFPAWLAEASKFEGKFPPAKIGELLYARRGCAQCHTIDGSKSIGPSWKNLYGSQQPLADGTSVLAEEDYIAESIKEPGKKIVAGFTNQMPVLQLKDKEISWIIAYMKTISPDHYHGDLTSLTTLGPTTGPTSGPTSGPAATPASGMLPGSAAQAIPPQPATQPK